MHGLRIAIRRQYHFAVALMALALCLKALVPVGYMPSASASGERRFVVTICAAMAGAKMVMAVPVAPKPAGDRKSAPDTGAKGCVFASLSQGAASPIPPSLLALALAAILLLGLAPLSPRTAARADHLRPPLRAPPLRILTL